MCSFRASYHIDSHIYDGLFRLFVGWIIMFLNLFSPHHCSLQSCECSKLGLAWCDCTAPRDPDGGLFQLVIGVPNNGWFLLGKIPSRNGWLGVALFLETRCRSKTWNSGEAGELSDHVLPEAQVWRWKTIHGSMDGGNFERRVGDRPRGPSGQLLWLRKSTWDSTTGYWDGRLHREIGMYSWQTATNNLNNSPCCLLAEI